MKLGVIVVIVYNALQYETAKTTVEKMRLSTN